MGMLPYKALTLELSPEISSIVTTQVGEKSPTQRAWCQPSTENSTNNPILVFLLQNQR